MAQLAELPLKYRFLMRRYRYQRIDPVPWTSLRRPLAQCRLALVSSAGFVAPDQPPFDHGIEGGDASFREIPADIDVGRLTESHRSAAFDHVGISRDPNLAFPIERARELVRRGRVGSVNRRHLSFMGSITNPVHLLRTTAPQAALLLAADAVDVALLVPV